jgi:hypothetical protein
MRLSLKAAIATSALLLASAPILLASDAVSQCGAAQMKIVGAFFKALAGESTKACGAGSAGHPQPVDSAKLTEITDKLNAALQTTIDKFGDANCSQKPTQVASSAITVAQGLANRLCLAPSPTPTSTP